MKLWCVTIERSIYVVAETEWQAERLGAKHEGDELFDEPNIVSAVEITDIKRVEKEWRDSLPYGGKNDQTCVQILEGES